MTVLVLVNGGLVAERPLDEVKGFFGGEHVFQTEDGEFTVSVNHFLAAASQAGGETHLTAIKAVEDFGRAIGHKFF